ncbi:MAG: HDOD domain-containing protein [Gammaproteobacteria bacterium]|nr:HDOD domain-containing protein [Gammaproteobacteria bacterium]MDH3858380.1 HDOD domain-containing protein [Gammaproteobacteria bacterium]
MTRTAELDIQPPVTLEQLIGQGQDLPSLPEIYLRVSEQLENESSTVQQIGDTVQNDPAITTRVLKMVNSAYYGMPNEVASVSQAVSLLGRERLKHILIGSVLRGVFSTQENPAFSMQVFWQHSIKTAIIARQLAIQLSAIKEPESMFTAGLLHDIGKLLLINKVPHRMLAVEEYMIQKRVDVLTAELSQVGVTHTAVGEALMDHWGLPQLLIDCARNHHEVVHDGANREATHLIYLANCLSTYVPPLDEQETQNILDDIENWDQGYATLEQIAYACQYAEDMVFEVMESLGMVALEIAND